MSANAWQDRYFASADGLRLYYRDYPAAESGPVPVLCLPGLTRNSRDFEAIALRIQRSRRVLSADLRGRGRSQHDPNWRNYHPGTYVADVARLLADAVVPRVIVLGTSLGGILAMIVAATAPQLLAGVILNDVGPEVAPEGLERISTYVGKSPAVRTWEEAAAQARATYGLAWPDATDEDWMSFARRSYEEVDGVPRLAMDPMIGEAVRAAPAGAAPDLWPVFAALRPIPTLALRGELSDVLSRETFDRMAREKPDLVRVTVPRRGHPPMLDEPESVQAIEQFLARLD
ncbi:MAG: alpha/beta hydrolase [Gammaproteobacteria bacterium]|nr:alpha/beta hydrolase [Gammaproteobacteria bacterium]